MADGRWQARGARGERREARWAVGSGQWAVALGQWLRQPLRHGDCGCGCDCGMWDLAPVLAPAPRTTTSTCCCCCCQLPAASCQYPVSSISISIIIISTSQHHGLPALSSQLARLWPVFPRTRTRTQDPSAPLFFNRSPPVWKQRIPVSGFWQCLYSPGAAHCSLQLSPCACPVSRLAVAVAVDQSQGLRLGGNSGANEKVHAIHTRSKIQPVPPQDPLIQLIQLVPPQDSSTKWY
jgi:hypothetical protein